MVGKKLLVSSVQDHIGVLAAGDRPLACSNELVLIADEAPVHLAPVLEPFHFFLLFDFTQFFLHTLVEELVWIAGVPDFELQLVETLPSRQSGVGDVTMLLETLLLQDVK